MRITCPFCGPRGLEEFTMNGDASVVRPDMSNTDPQAWHDYVHIRDNPKGVHREFFHHAGGCRAWLVVTRNVVTHEILDVELAREART